MWYMFLICRDIKPANILLVEDEHCTLGDFGVAALKIFEGKKVRDVCGARPYMT
jgi:serine/threonine protein kinase